MTPRAREQVVLALLASGSKSVVPYLLEAGHDSRGELRALACRHLVPKQALYINGLKYMA